MIFVCLNYVCQHLSVIFHSKSSFQSDSFLFVQMLLFSLPPVNQVFDFFSRFLNALSARKWEKSENQKVWVCFSVSLYPIKFLSPVTKASPLLLNQVRIFRMVLSSSDWITSVTISNLFEFLARFRFSVYVDVRVVTFVTYPAFVYSWLVAV